MASPSLTDVQEQMQQLKTMVQALALQQEDYVNVKPITKIDNKEDNNPLAEDDKNPIIEQGFKFELLPEFHGGQSPEELLDWIVTVEEILDFKRIPLERCVPMVAMRFRGSAAAWWTQLKSYRARSDKPRILSWEKLKKKMRETFLPFNYDQVMFQRLHKLQQGKRSVEEYYPEFSWLLTRVDLHDSDQQILERFVGGLRQQKIKDTLNLLNPLQMHIERPSSWKLKLRAMFGGK